MASPSAQTHPRQRPYALILLIFVAYVALGLPDGLLGVGWPSIRHDFGIPIDALGFLLFVTLTGYITSSFLSGPLTARMGVGRLLMLSCLLTGLGLIGYTLVPQWWMMVALGTLAGLGAGAIDTALTAYVAKHFGPGLMQWLHASFGVGVTIGPLLMTYFLTNAHNWRLGYLVVGGFQLLLALVFSLTLFLWRTQPVLNANGADDTVPAENPSLGKTLSMGSAWLGGMLFFFYVGSEVLVGTWTFSLLTEARGVPEATAGLITGSYWFTFTIGRILGGLVAHRLSLQKLVGGCIVVALLGALLLLWDPFAYASVLAVALIGFAVAPIYPGLMSGTAQRVGLAHTENVVGIQTAFGQLGGVGIVSLVGVMARQWGLEVVPNVLCVTLTSLLVLYRMALSGSRAGS